MCGIAGYIDWKATEEERLSTIEHMGKTLVCRGPDADGTWRNGPAAFAHRRLIVIDPEGGTQPMVRHIEDRTYAITYNGELYNMDELRIELEQCGHTFETRSDTELLLLSYVQWGPQCVEKLNGIFAFGIWDAKNQTLFMARDRLGVKPLFYTERRNIFVFGSELKAILAHPSVPTQVDLEGLAELLLIGPAHTPGHAVFKGIREVRPGYSLLYSKNGLKLTQYWRLDSHEHEDDIETTAQNVRNLLRDAVSRQLVSDVPVVTFLSGGLDSSAVSALASEEFTFSGRGPLHTYSVDFANMDEHFEANAFQTGRDTPWARRVSNYLGTVHHEVIFDTPVLIEHVMRPLAARDLPGMADIDISLYLFCKEIKKDATVALSGEAADEVFGGYPWFHREDALQADTFPWSLQLQERIRLLSPEFLARLNPTEYVADRYRDALAEVPTLPGEDRSEARLREISYLNLTRFLTTLLERKDRMSMATGLEVRVPFCDHRLVEYVWNIPWSIKRFDGTAKAILRKAIVGLLPDDVVYRRKSPYPSTHNPAYLVAVRSFMEQILDDKTQPIHALINEQAVRDLIQASYQKLEHRPWFGQIMAIPQMFDYLIQINTWLKDYKVELTW